MSDKIQTNEATTNFASIDYQRLGLAVAEMLSIAYTFEWITYLMDVMGVPQEYERPDGYSSKWLFCKDLFMHLSENEETRDIIVEVAKYVVQSQRFDVRYEAEARVHLPTFLSLIKAAGAEIPLINTINIAPLFQTRSFRKINNFCCVFMPLDKSWSENIWTIIQESATQSGFLCERVIDLYRPNAGENIWTTTNESSIVLADMTTKCPSVLFGLGVACALGKKIILLARNSDDIPCDFLNLPSLTYEDSPQGTKPLRAMLKQYLTESI